jgi:hypothetical protein
VNRLKMRKRRAAKRWKRKGESVGSVPSVSIGATAAFGGGKNPSGRGGRVLEPDCCWDNSRLGDDSRVARFRYGLTGRFG